MSSKAHRKAAAQGGKGGGRGGREGVEGGGIFYIYTGERKASRLSGKRFTQMAGGRQACAVWRMHSALFEMHNCCARDVAALASGCRHSQHVFRLTLSAHKRTQARGWGLKRERSE